MTNRHFQKQIAERFGASVRFDEPMSRHTSLKVGGAADVYAIPKSLDELEMLICYCREHGIEYIIVGGGTNLLVKDTGIRGMVIVLTHCLNKLVQDKSRIRAMAGVKTAALCRFAIKNSLKGMNFALGIPGTVGGALCMNAGTASGAMGDRLESLTVLLSSGERQVLSRHDLNLSYRKLSWQNKHFGKDVLILEGSFILEPADAKMLEQEAREILSRRHQSQPTRFPSAGCFFKNPPGASAGQLIDLAGFKGKCVGGAQVSEKHANFIINRGSGCASDILALAKMIQEKVYRMFDLMLEPEVKIVG
jgi:UDP-N-acetylmuramate dehydrogenase